MKLRLLVVLCVLCAVAGVAQASAAGDFLGNVSDQLAVMFADSDWSAGVHYGITEEVTTLGVAGRIPLPTSWQKGDIGKAAGFYAYLPGATLVEGAVINGGMATIRYGVGAQATWRGARINAAVDDDFRDIRNVGVFFGVSMLAR